MSAAGPRAIACPRRLLLRYLLRRLGRIALRLLTRTSVQGRANLPAGGPLILVGNHVALMEVVLMTLLVPWEIEIIGTGDIPMDPRYAWLVRLWGYLPVNRGSVSRDEMQLPLDILCQNGVVGIFPEGGIWSPRLKRAHTGVAWLSYRGKAPVLPIGFGGMEGALGAILALKRPRLTMNIGALLPPAEVERPGLSRKQALAAAANDIMACVAALIPAAERRAGRLIQDERYDFTLEQGATADTLRKVAVTHGEGLGRFFHTPIILDVLTRNMRLPVQGLQNPGQPQPAEEVRAALAATIAFLDAHPHFLSYRFGYARAAEIDAGVRELHALAQEAAGRAELLRLRPLYRFRRGSSAEVQRERPGSLHDL